MATKTDHNAKPENVPPTLNDWQRPRRVMAATNERFPIVRKRKSNYFAKVRMR